MGTKLTELRNGCFARALDDEEMFVLLARDKHAPSHVRTWCSVRIAEIANGQRPASDMAQIIEAQQCADKMEKWRKEHEGEWRTGLFPDMTDDDRARFLAGDFPPITEAEETALRPLRPRTGDEAWELELAESEGGLLRVAASEAADLIGTLDERAMYVAKQIQERYKLSDAKRDRIAKNIADTLRKPGRRTAYEKAGVADPEKVERIAYLPLYVWAVLIFAAGFIVGTMPMFLAGCHNVP